MTAGQYATAGINSNTPLELSRARQVRIRANYMAGFRIDQVDTAAKSAGHRLVNVIVRRVRMIRARPCTVKPVAGHE